MTSVNLKTIIDKCYCSNLRRKFLEQDGAVTLDSLLKVGRAPSSMWLSP